MLATVNTPAPTPTQYQRRQIGARLNLIAGTPLYSEAGFRLLSKQSAKNQAEIIDRLMNSPVAIDIEAQRIRNENRAARQAIKAKSVKADHADALAALVAVMKDERRLENLCRDLVSRGEQHGSAALAARMFVAYSEILHDKIAATKGTLTSQRAPVVQTDAAVSRWLTDAHDQPSAVALVARYFAALADNIVEAELSPSHRLLIAANRAELIAGEIDPDATASALAIDDESESPWSFMTRTRQCSRYRDRMLDASADVEPELQLLISQT